MVDVTPRVTSARKLFYLEAFYWCTMSVVIVVLFVVILEFGWREFIERMERHHGNKLDEDLIIFSFVLEFLTLIVQVLATTLLYNGTRKNDHKSIVRSGILNIIGLFFMILQMISDFIAFSNSGPGFFKTGFMIYRLYLVKIIYDAAKELRRVPTTVPFVRVDHDEETL